MTLKLIYEAVLVELNKVNAPSLLLEDFNVLANKALNLYINKRYNVYDTNLQTTDDLRVLKATATLTPVKSTVYANNEGGMSAVLDDDVTMLDKLFGATYEVNLPDDYLHMLNCICIYYVTENNKCYDEGNFVSFGADKLTADMWGEIINNWYMRPSYKKPYYYIHNVNINENVPTNPIIIDNSGKLVRGTDFSPVNTESKPVTCTYGVTKDTITNDNVPIEGKSTTGLEIVFNDTSNIKGLWFKLSEGYTYLIVDSFGNPYDDLVLLSEDGTNYITNNGYLALSDPVKIRLTKTSLS